MIKFGNSTIEDCYFKNIQTLCYEQNTCNSIHLSDRILSDSEAKNEYKICSERKNDENEDGKTNYFIINGIILVCIITILIGIISKFIFILKKKYIKNLENVQYISSGNDNDNEHENNNCYSRQNLILNKLSVDNLISNNLNPNNSNSFSVPPAYDELKNL